MKFNDVLSGNTLANILVGHDGDEILAGGLGADILVGEGGVDTVTYAASNAAVSVDLATFLNSGGHAAGDRLYELQRVIGSAFDEAFRVLFQAATWKRSKGPDVEGK